MTSPILDHPDHESIAELLDGRLTAAARAQLLEHLDACPRCFELVAEIAAFRAEESQDAATPERVEGTSGQVLAWPAPAPARRRSQRWQLAAAAAGIAVLTGLIGWLGTVGGGAVLPGGETGEMVAHLAAPPGELLAVGLREVEAGVAGFARRPAESRAVLAGAALVDLAIAHHAELEAHALSQRCRALAAHTETQPDCGDLEALEVALAAELPGEMLGLGRWIEATRVAAETGDLEFLTRYPAPPILGAEETLTATRSERDALIEARERVARNPDPAHLVALASAARELLLVQ